MPEATERYAALCNQQIDALRKRLVTEIDPESVAAGVYDKLDPEHVAPTDVHHLAELELRQIARSCLRKTFDPEARAQEAQQSGQLELLSAELQGYYPNPDMHRKGIYIELDALTDDQGEALARRMEKSGRTLIQQAENMRRYLADRPAFGLDGLSGLLRC